MDESKKTEESTQETEQSLPDFIKNPQRRDYWLLGLFLFSTIFNIASMVLKPILLESPWIMVAMSGSRTGMVISGAHVSTFGSSWVIPLVLGIVGAVKFLPIFWAAGSWWGQEFIDYMLQGKERTKRFISKVEKISLRFSPIAVFLCYVPGSPLPLSVICAIFGAAGMGFKKFLTVNILALLVIQSINLWLGWRFGEPVIQVVEAIAKYSLWVSLVILIVVLAKAWRDSRKRQTVTR